VIRRKTEAPRGVLKTAGAEQRYRHQRYYASPDLDPIVEHYWSVDWDLRGQPPQLVETLPHPSVHMTFERNEKSEVRGPARARFSRFLERKGRVFAVKFRPGGFYPLVRVSVSRFTDTVMSIEDIFGPQGLDLARTVLKSDDDSYCIAAVETFFRTRRPQTDEDVRSVSEIVYAVAREREILKVQDLIDRYEIDQRTLQRLFACYVGVSPKWVIQRYRLHEAAERLAGSITISQSELALSLGYSDQAHFVRDFKAIVGVSPAAYAQKAK
jgi:AraC-like DNA-binding protein